jgi:hypothetical protein
MADCMRWDNDGEPWIRALKQQGSHGIAYSLYNLRSGYLAVKRFHNISAILPALPFDMRSCSYSGLYFALAVLPADYVR